MKVISAPRKMGKKFTVDIEVAKTHTYQLENGLVSHNSVSLLSGVSFGIHYPHSEYYIRRIRFDVKSEYVPILKKAGYHIEPDVANKQSVVVDFPLHEKLFCKGKKDVTIWEQLENAALYQHYWSDNQVSITVEFAEHEKEDLKIAIPYFERSLKSISLLPRGKYVFKQMPYEEITKEEYQKLSKKLKPYTLHVKTAGEGVKGCDGDKCEIVQKN